MVVTASCWHQSLGIKFLCSRLKPLERVLRGTISDTNLTFNKELTLATKCALKVCMRNSSPTLNTLTLLSTCSRCTCSLILDNNPCCAGVPQKISNITFRHSQREWNSPMWIIQDSLTLSLVFPYQEFHEPMIVCPRDEVLLLSTTCTLVHSCMSAGHPQ